MYRVGKMKGSSSLSNKKLLLILRDYQKDSKNKSVIQLTYSSQRLPDQCPH